MKFTNEQAVEALRAELTNKGRKTLHMSDRTLVSMTENLVKRLANEETGLPEFVADAIEILNITEGDARKKNSDFAKYKSEHEESNEPQKDPEPPQPTENLEIKAYEERIAALEKRLQEADAKSVLAQKRADLTAKLKEKGVKDDEWLNGLLSEVNITAETDVDAKAESYVKLYNKSKANVGNPVPPATPNGGSPNDKVKLDDVASFVEQNNHI